MAKTMRNRAVNSKTLFITTSPRTPFKMLPEITLLDEEMNGEEWTPETQAKFYYLLRDRDFFEGEESKTPALSARDRINRSPKALGFVSLPIVGLTPVGKEFVESNNKEEILLRQMLKFQLPSPYHPLGNGAADFCVKPYLELFRLIRTLGTLSFDEMQIFGMQLVNYNYFEDIVEKINQFRKDKEQHKKQHKGKCKEFKQKVFYREAKAIYEDEILSGNISTRESRTTTIESFLDKKISNLRDYADAGVRYLRATGLVSVTAVGKSLSIIPEKIKDVDFILSTVEREPCFVNELCKYENYLWSPTIPKLLTDDKDKIIDKLSAEFNISVDRTLSINRLKDILSENIQKRKEEKISEQVKVLKDYTLYNDIDARFDDMGKSYEPSLFFEWNTWRAMTMLNGGNIKANLKFDDSGNPMSTALGKMADIECDYGDFDVTVEVSLSSGALQFKMEGEPVPRHIGIHKEKTNKPTYCFFIAPTINPATIAHFYTLYISNVDLYGGKCTIIPLRLDTFRKMLKDAVDAPTKPNPSNIKRLFEKSQKLAKECFINDENETIWYQRITNEAMNWLAVLIYETSYYRLQNLPTSRYVKHIAMINFISLDLETATASRSSICQIGITEVIDGVPQAPKSWLVQPEGNQYDSMNIWIHGITPEDTKDSPSFPEVWKEVYPYLEGKTVVAHNTSFDMYALRDAFDNYGMEYPTFDYFCTLRIARYIVKGCYSYSLDVVLNHLNIEFGVHHKADSDSLGCALLLLKCLELDGSSLDDLESKYNFHRGKFAPNTFIAHLAIEKAYGTYESFIKNLKINPDAIDEGNYFFGKSVCFTGTCQYGIRKELLKKVAEVGGIPTDSVTAKTDVLVVGQQDYRVVGDSGMSSKQKKALQLLEKGNDIEILSETEFLSRI